MPYDEGNIGKKELEVAISPRHLLDNDLRRYKALLSSFC